MKIERYIDHTLLNASASLKDVDLICEEAIKYNFFSVCVNPVYVKYVARKLVGTNVKTCSVVGFPLGQNIKEVKAFETRKAIEDGADEIDMVINYAFLKDSRLKEVEEEIRLVKESCNGRLLKVIIECSELEQNEIKIACELCEKSGADFVKTSTGFSKSGAMEEDIKLMKKSCDLQIKASGGIRDYKKALSMINSGATRLGASAGINILNGQKNESL